MAITSSIERSPVRRPTRTAHAATADLIRTIAGAEAPAAGEWTVGRGQPVTLTRRGLRRRTMTGRVVAGVLVVTDDVVGSSLELTVQTHDDVSGEALVPTRDPPPPLTFTLRVTKLWAIDRWRAEGIVDSGAGSQPVAIDVSYRGVFRGHGQASLWLALEGGLELTELRAGRESFARSRFRLDADLNLSPSTAPFSLP
jgi:hypothetical protein